MVQPCPKDCAFDWVEFHKLLDVAMAHMIDEKKILPSKTDLLQFAEYSNNKQGLQQLGLSPKNAKA